MSSPDLTSYMGIRDRSILEIFYSTGVRISEIVNIRTNDIELDAIERGADWIDTDSFITGKAYSKWYKENKLPEDIKLQKEIEQLDKELEQLDKDHDGRTRRISQDVKDKVWNRDNGVCSQCGSNEDLEFDHIIPHSKGGANTYRNIQLLCEECNRRKSDNIG